MFEKAVELVLKHEAGYVNNPKDPGGETNFGIAKRSYPNVDIKNLTRDQAKAIYKRDFWDAIQCDKLPAVVAVQVFDAAVNSGSVNAVRWLQRALGINADGVLGSKTIDSANGMNPDKLVRLFLAERLEFYCKLTTFSEFGKGWVRRVAANMRHN